MKNTNLVIGIVVALLVGGGVGYSLGKGANDGGVAAKELQDSIQMMQEQSVMIQKMGEMMKSGGMAMQEMGTKYQNDGMMAQGKDWEVVGGKYLKENADASEMGSMKDMMH